MAIKLTAIIHSLGLKVLDASEVAEYKENMRSDTMKWIRYPIAEYKKPIPRPVLDLALKVRKALETHPLIDRDMEEIFIEIDELAKVRPKVEPKILDPFLVLRFTRHDQNYRRSSRSTTLSHTAFIAVWDEHEYNSGKLYTSPIFEDAPHPITIPDDSRIFTGKFAPRKKDESVHDPYLV
jgi:hypothetical protein